MTDRERVSVPPHAAQNSQPPGAQQSTQRRSIGGNRHIALVPEPKCRFFDLMGILFDNHRMMS
jgi:hypothetical protein